MHYRVPSVLLSADALGTKIELQIGDRACRITFPTEQNAGTLHPFLEDEMAFRPNKMGAENGAILTAYVFIVRVEIDAILVLHTTICRSEFRTRRK